MWRWIGRFVLNIVAFEVAWTIANYLIHALFNLGIRGGMRLSPSLPQTHFLYFSFLGGLIAGLFPFDLIRHYFLFHKRDHPAENIEPIQNHPKSWVWVLFSVWLLYGIVRWILKMQPHSVLANSSGVLFTSIFNSFWGDDCTAFVLNFRNVAAIEMCLNQVVYTAPWAGAVAYSVTGLILHKISAKIKTTITELEDSSTARS